MLNKCCLMNVCLFFLISLINGIDINDRKAVVCNYKNKANTNWLTKTIQTQDVGIESSIPRYISESGPWLQWIVDHYNNLPDFVIFLHGDQHSWHSDIDINYISKAQPKKVEMLSKYVWRTPDFYYGHEKFGLDLLYFVIFGFKFLDGWKKWNMAQNYRCCSEMIVSKKAIYKYDIRVYRSLVHLIESSHNPWGWIFERTWQNLFSNDIKKTTEEILTGIEIANKTFILIQHDLDNSLISKKTNCVIIQKNNTFIS